MVVGHKLRWSSKTSSSHPHYLISLSSSLPLSLASSLAYLSLLRTTTTNHERQQRKLFLLHAPVEENQGMPKWGELASFTVKHRHCWWVRRVTESWGEVVDPSFSDQPTGGSGYQQVQPIPLVVIVPSVRDESGQISKHAFRGKLSKL